MTRETEPTTPNTGRRFDYWLTATPLLLSRSRALSPPTCGGGRTAPRAPSFAPGLPHPACSQSLDGYAETVSPIFSVARR
jgi:hypothetical protein